MADIFDEIDEELKRDRMQELWNRFGKYLIAVVATVVLGVGANQGYGAWKKSRESASADLYSQALTASDTVAALESNFEEMSGGYQILARFQIAAGKAADGDLEAAEAAYREIAASSAVPELYREAALLMSVMNAPRGASTRELKERIAPVADGAGPWKPLALELRAALDLAAGDNDAALDSLHTIIDLPDAPSELRQRAQGLIDAIDS